MEKTVFEVRDLLNRITRKIAFDEEIGGNITVRGEIAGFKVHGRHAYFSIKDEESLLKCVFFSYASSYGSEIPTGSVADIHGQVKIYEPRGDLQFYANRIEILSEKGMLQMRYEKMKKKLLYEGIIPKPGTEKKSLREYPRIIAVIASRTSAALQDVIKTLNIRNPTVKIELYHTAVQGEKAHLQIIKALKTAEKGCADSIIMVRGGGSPEDLWCFNEESLVQEIRICSKPVIVGVGHEIDHCLSEYAADRIASTPTAAAVMASLPISDLLNSKKASLDKISVKLKKETNQSKNMLRLQKMSISKLHPKEILKKKDERLRESVYLIEKSVNSKIKDSRFELLNMKALLRAYSPDNTLETKKIEFDGKIKQLAQLNPLNTVLRGYSWVESNDRIADDTSEIRVGEKIKVVMRDGYVVAVVEEINKTSKTERIGFDEKKFKI